MMPSERCVVASEHQEALVAFDEPPFARGASGGEIAALYRASLLRRRPAAVPYRLLSVPERHRGLPVPTRGFLSTARELGCPVHVWTVDAPATARKLWRRGVAGIVTNTPGAIIEVRDAARRAESSLNRALTPRLVILSAAKEPKRVFGSFAALRMTSVQRSTGSLTALPHSVHEPS